jgi:hypothetical protein
VALLAAPSPAPSLSSSAGGALGATTYFVKTTYVNQYGETVASAESSLAVAANNVLVVTSPAALGNATGYNVYVSTTTGTETKQNGGTPIAIGTNWTEPTTGLVAGSALPGTNTAAQDYWITIQDPNQIGDTPSTLSSFLDLNSTRAQTPGFTYLGKIKVSDVTAGGAQGQGGGSSGPI